jgi:hypothetical protein
LWTISGIAATFVEMIAIPEAPASESTIGRKSPKVGRAKISQVW